MWFAAFGIVLLVTLGWVATQSGPLAPIQVTVTPVVRGDVSPALFGIGTVEARRAYLIGPTAAGRVKRVLVDVGDTVKAGQLLAEMEPVDLDTRIAATLAAAERGRSAVDAAEAQLRDARSRQALAAAEARRTEALGTGGRRQSERRGRGAAGASSRPTPRSLAAEAALAGARRDLARLDADIGAAQQQRGNLRLSPRSTAWSPRVTPNRAPRSLPARPCSSWRIPAASGSPCGWTRGAPRASAPGCRPSSRGEPTP